MSKVSDTVSRIVKLIADETGPDKFTRGEAAAVLELVIDDVESSLDALRDEMKDDEARDEADEEAEEE